MNYAHVCKGLLKKQVAAQGFMTLAESHKGDAHERAVQTAMIDSLPAGAIVLIEAGSFNDSLEIVATYARRRKDITVRYADCSGTESPKSLSDAFVFEKSRALYNAAVEAQRYGQTVLFCGAGHLQGIARAAKKNGSTCVLANTAAPLFSEEKNMMRGFLQEQFATSDSRVAASEIGKIMQTVTFAYNAAKVLQIRP